jgi:hypothetical protein
MFDGIDRLPIREPVLPPRPAPLDARSLLPLLREQAAEAAVEALAYVVGSNAAAAGQWIRLNWGDADLRDPLHPARVAALDASSPSWKLAEAVVALGDACRRYRAATGNDGLSLARPIVERLIPGHADSVLQPLEVGAEMSARVAASFLHLGDPAAPIAAADLDAAIAELLSPAPEPAAPEPTAAQRRAGRSAIADWLLTAPELDGITERLGALLSACKAEGYDHSADAVSHACESLRAAIDDVLARGFDPECLQAALRCWSAATGGPRINLIFSLP